MVVATVVWVVYDARQLSEYATAAPGSSALEADLLHKLYENALAMAMVSVAGTGAMFASTSILEIGG